MEQVTLIEMAKILSDFTETEKESILNNIRNRDWYGSETPQDFLDDVEPFTDEEHTLWEQGYLQALEDVKALVMNFILK